MIKQFAILSPLLAVLSTCALSEDWEPSLTATSSVQIVTATSDAIPDMSAYIPKKRTDVAGEFKMSQGVDSSSRLYLFLDDTYMRVSFMSSAAMRIDDEGDWKLKEGIINLSQAVNRMTNSLLTADTTLIPVKKGKDVYLVGAHWVYSFVRMPKNYTSDAEFRFMLFGNQLEKRFDLTNSIKVKTALFDRWKAEEPRRNKEDSFGK